MRTGRIFLTFLGLVLAATLVTGAATPARAERTLALDADLDRLFGALARSEDAFAASQIEREIWANWLQSGSATVDLIMARGLEALAEENYALALDFFSTAIELDPTYAEAWNKRATLYYLIDDYDAAMEDVAHVISLEPRHFGALAGMAVILEELGEKKAALEAYRQAHAVHPHLDRVEDAISRLKIEVEGRGI